MTTSNPLVLEMPDIATFTVLRKEFNPVSFFNSECYASSGKLSFYSYFRLPNHLCVVYECPVILTFLTCRYIPCILQVIRPMLPFLTVQCHYKEFM